MPAFRSVAKFAPGISDLLSRLRAFRVTLEQARARTRKAIEDRHADRLKALDADLLEQKAALVPKFKAPDPARVLLLAAKLAKFTPQERAVFYNAATGDERREMEAASVATGRLPTK